MFIFFARVCGFYYYQLRIILCWVAKGRLQFIGGPGNTPHMTITATWNVGLGTTTKTSKLDVMREINVNNYKIKKVTTPAELTTPKFNWIKEGDVINIVGGKSFEIVEIHGH